VSTAMKNLIEIACEQACQAIAPAWPLDKSIAVNPHWSRVNMPVRRVAARMAVLGGIQVFPPRVQIRQAWDDGRIQPIDLNNALQQLNQKNTKALTARQCEDALYARSTTQQLPLLIDVLDNDPQRHTRLSWRQAITHQVSQTCAAYFDEHQADWRPNREHGLYHFWRDTLSHDHGIGMLMGLPTIGQAIAALPSSAQEAEQWAFERLGLRADAIEQTEQAMAVDEVWQLALELGYQRQLASELAKHTMQAKTPVQPQAKVQAAFCIDVRSEPLRRALEAAHPAIQTLGVAGFFGLPVDYTPMGSKASRPQLPGLLAPAMHVSDRVLMAGQTDGAQQQQAQENAESARQKRLSLLEQWRAAARWPGAAFSYVEAAGLGYLGKLSQWIKPTGGDRENDDLLGIPARYKALCRPQLLGLDLQSKTQLAAQVLNAMGLKTHIAPLVLPVGHGSQTTNNAHAASLDCGACCGQTGEVNARALADLLNDSQVRSNLENNGFSIPASTWFVAGLHNTTTDEIEGFDIDLLPEDARKQWNELQAILITASDQTRRERAPSLGLNAKATPQALLEQVKRRANDGAQARPEWGLAGNAAFLIAPRYRSAGANLQGRSFLHDYDVTQDPEGQLLEQLMTAPMLVTHWINWQYHASRCDPARLGSGNKLLHNVVGGTLGVFEGNGGDLRIGLSEQSLHNGKRWMHEPLRLTVIIDAPSAMIQRVIDKHAIVQQLVNNDWLHLWRFAEGGFERYSHGKWLSVSLLEQEHEWIAQT